MMRPERVSRLILLLAALGAAAPLAAPPARADGAQPGDGSNDGYEEGQVPRGLTPEAATEYYHLTEGADFYPLEWIQALKSARFKDAHGHPLPFFQDLDARFGILRSPRPADFLSPYIGVSVGWTNSRPETMDARRSEAGTLTRVGEAGLRSVKVAGTTCSLCHSSGWQVGGKFYRIEGAPSRVDSIAFFEDLAISTLNLLAKRDLMTEFLRAQKVPDPERKAREQVDFFLTELGKDTHWIYAGKLSGKITLGFALKGKLGRLHHGKRALGVALERLARITYGFAPGESLGDLKPRLEFIASLCAGDNPKVKEPVINPGPGRFDAFDRLAIATLKRDDLRVDAPVRYPPMWSLKYTAMVHYNANTNSVLMRNAGEAFGLGAAVNYKTWDSSINFRNLDRIERMLYDVKVPQWTEVFAGRPELAVNEKLADRGRTIYLARCAECHTTSSRVGPEHRLYEYNLYTLQEIGTDPRQALNLNPVGQQMNQGLRELTLGVRGRYYEKYRIPADVQARWELRDLRGGEFFRWTALGDSYQQALYGNNYGNVVPGMGYRARHLAGIWAAAPFLHNGSVPTLWDLLNPASKRPVYFNTATYRYDPVNLGLAGKRPAITRRNLLGRVTYAGPKPCGKDEAATCFDATETGNWNLGHEGPRFGTDLPDADKRALLEYLKILPPEPEYGWTPAAY